MIAKSLLLVLLLPPINLIVGVLVGVAVLRRLPRFGRWLISACGGLLLLLAMPVVAGSMLTALETDLPLTPPKDDPPQAIVILSAELERTGGPDPGAVVGRLTLERLRAGAALARRTRLPVLVTGGQTRRTEPAVGALMALSLPNDFGVPVRWSETHSRTTWENATDSAAILRSAGIHSVYVVTHAWHERRAMIAFRRAGLVATAAPVLLDAAPRLEPDNFIPRPSALQTSYYAMHEWIGCAWYALR